MKLDVYREKKPSRDVLANWEDNGKRNGKLKLFQI